MFSNSNSVIIKVRYYSNFIMIALYLILGLLFLFSKIAIEVFPIYREAIGGLLISYTFFRMYLILKKKNINK